MKHLMSGRLCLLLPLLLMMMMTMLMLRANASREAGGRYRSGPASNTTPSWEHKLIKNMFRYYDPSVRPRYNSSETVSVSVRFSLQQINDLDEKRQILKMSGWLTAEWTDEFLVWDASAYGGLTSIVVEPRRLWIPKLAIGNSANKLFDGDHYKRFWITVRNSGHARWQPGGVFAIACALDMNFYPFDDQKCTMEIETWVYTADKVNLTSSMPVIGMDTYIPHGEWTILRTNVESINMIYRYYLSEQFPEVYFTVYMRRKYTFYFLYILLPCLMLSGVLLMVFLLPADSGEKVSLGVSILVAISVFLLLVAGNVPDTSDAIPIIAIYLTYFMMVTTLSVAFSVLVIKLHYKSPDSAPPQWLRVLVFHYIARFVCLNRNNVMSKLLRMRPTGRRASSASLRNAVFASATTTPRPPIPRDLGWSELRPSFPPPPMSTLTQRRSYCDFRSPTTNSSRLTTPSGHDVVWDEQENATEQFHCNSIHSAATDAGGETFQLLRYQRRVRSPYYESPSDFLELPAPTSQLRTSFIRPPPPPVEHSGLPVLNDDFHASSGARTRRSTGLMTPPPLGNVNEWKKMAEVLDRFFFYLFLAFVIVPTVSILGVMRLFKPEIV